MRSSPSSEEYVFAYTQTLDQTTAAGLKYFSEDAAHVQSFNQFWEEFDNSNQILGLDVDEDTLALAATNPKIGLTVIWTVDMNTGNKEDLTFYDQLEVG